MNLSLKQEHELFVSGHNGSDVFDVNLAVFSAPLAVMMFRIVEWILITTQLYKTFIVRYLTEYALLVVMVLLAFTCFSDVLVPYYLTVICIILSWYFFVNFTTLKNKIENIGEEDEVEDLEDEREIQTSNVKKDIPVNKPSYISVHRSYVNIATAICILAVDFKIFPRRFCKTETFGSSLMDVGVGSFVVSNAIVSREARGLTKRPGFRSLLRVMLSTWPLMLLGLGRLLAVKSVDYHEVISEYGVHWNFFFTLAFVKIASTFVYIFIPASYSTLISLTISIFYEVLQKFNYADYILSPDQRYTFMDQNKEGIFSCLGYLSLYFISVSLGRFLLKMHSYDSQWLSMKLKSFYMLLMSAALWILLRLCCNYVNISRRLANSSYVVWMMAYNVQLIMFFLLVDVASICFGFHKNSHEYQKEPKLLAAINNNGLFFFLISNLFTGLINMSYDVIHASTFVAMVILISYTLTLSTIAYLLHSFNIKIKFW